MPLYPSIEISTIPTLQTTLNQKADVSVVPDTFDDLVDGTTNKAFTSTLLGKVNGIATGAEVNVNADWLSSSGDSQILNKPSTFPPIAHKLLHENGGADEISVTGLSGLLADAQNPVVHATSHKSGGADAIKLDELAAPTDITTLDASTAAHGLMQKYPGGTSTFLRADGSFATPTAAPADLDMPETGALTVATGKYHLTAKSHQATGSQRITVAGTGRLRIQN